MIRTYRFLGPLAVAATALGCAPPASAAHLSSGTVSSSAVPSSAVPSSTVPSGTVRSLTPAKQLPAGYTPINTGHGMCLDDTRDIARDGEPVQVWKCLGDANQAWQAEPDGTIRNANGYCLGTGTAASHYAGVGNGTPVVMVSCAAAALGSYWTVNAFPHQLVNKYATEDLDNRLEEQHDRTPVVLWDPASGVPQGKDWNVVSPGGRAPVVTPGKPPALHVDGANMVTAAGQVFVPRGFTLSALEYTVPYRDGVGAYTSVLAESRVQIDAIAGAWHGNIVRLQLEQDDLVVREAAGDHSYLDLIRSVVGYAKSKGLVVVLNAQTEPNGRLTGNEPLPTQETVKFWQLLRPYYGNDDSVVIDVFNEPRPLTGTTVRQYMSLWRNGGGYQGVSYLGHEQLAKTLRTDGYASNVLWVEPPGNYALEGLTLPAGAPATFLLSGISNLSYSFHHPTVLGTARTPANWDAQFGDLVKDHELSVNDGEWATRAQYTGFRAANGDSGTCWTDAPAAVPRYFSYLQQLGVGMTVWTLSDGEPGIGTTAGSDRGSFTTTASMTGWPGCANAVPVDGPGALIMAWFARQAG